MRASNPSWSRNVEIQPLHECEAESGLKHHNSGSIVCLVPKGNVFIWNNPALVQRVADHDWPSKPADWVPVVTPLRNIGQSPAFRHRSFGFKC